MYLSYNPEQCHGSTLHTDLAIFQHLEQRYQDLNQNPVKPQLSPDDIMKAYFAGAITATAIGIFWPAIATSFAIYLLLGVIWNMVDLSALIDSWFERKNPNPHLAKAAKANMAVSGAVMGGTTVTATGLLLANGIPATTTCATGMAVAGSMFSFSAAMFVAATNSSIAAHEARRSAKSARYSCDLFIRNFTHDNETNSDNITGHDLAISRCKKLKNDIERISQKNASFLVKAKDKLRLVKKYTQLKAAQNRVEAYDDAKDNALAMYRYTTQIEHKDMSDEDKSTLQEKLKIASLATEETNFDEKITIQEILQCELYFAKQRNLRNEHILDATASSLAAVGTGFIASGLFFAPLAIPGILITCLAGAIKAAQLYKKFSAKPKVNHVSQNERRQAYQTISNQLNINNSTSENDDENDSTHETKDQVAKIENELIKNFKERFRNYCNNLDELDQPGQLRQQAIDMQCKHIYLQQSLPDRKVKQLSNSITNASFNLFSHTKIESNNIVNSPSASST